MKKRLFTLGMVLALVSALVVPVAVLAETTEVTGTVERGYTFTAPSAIVMGALSPGATYSGNSTDGNLTGNNPTGYTVEGTDNKIVNTGYMWSPRGPLGSKLEISNEDANYVTANNTKTFVDTSGVTDEAFSLYVKQFVAYGDPVGAYSITITFTVTAKPPV